MHRDFLQPASWTLKIVAAVFWLSTASVVFYVDVPNLRASTPPHYRDAPTDWGTPAYYQRVWWRLAKTVLMVALVLLPNRVLVASRLAFIVSVLVAALITCQALLRVFHYFEFSTGDFLFLALKIAVLAALPVSLVLSYVRFQRGEIVAYA